ncbi:MAG: peptidase, partial [Myxococcota bacterium]
AANGLDLNRDQTKLEVHESPALKQAFHEVDPAVAVDFHEYRAYRRDYLWLGTRGISNPYDVMFLYSGNLNVPEALRSLTDDVFVQAVREEMDNRGLRHHDYVTTRKVHRDIWFNQGSVQSRSSATNWALANTVSLLVEVRGVALGRDAFERRVLTTFWVAAQVLRTAAEDPDRVHTVLEQTIGLPREIAVTQRPTVHDAQLKAIDVADHGMIDLDVTLRDNLQSEATLTRSRPEAYAVLPGSDALLDKLRTLGLEVVPLSAPAELAVERYDVRDVRREPYAYEGQRQQDVTVDVTAATQTLPAGSHLVRLDVPGANIALEVFEPECPNSFVSFGVVRARPGKPLPFVRVTDGAAELLSTSVR